MSSLQEILFRVPAVLLALTIHECAHGYVAYKLGDPTAKYNGRLSLSPLAHLDIMGTLCMLLFGFGWAKPVPVNPMYFKNPKQGMSLIGLAGPLSNLLQALIYSLLLGIGYRTGFFFSQSTFTQFLMTFLIVALSLNVGLAIFNLIPIPPLDGSKILAVFLPNNAYYKLMAYERYAMPILMLLLWTNVLTVPLNFISDKVFSALLIFINWIAGF